MWSLVICLTEKRLEALIETHNLKTLFPILRGLFRKHVGDVRAVDGINLSIAHKQWMGLVGESGCGKTTLGKTILRLLKPTSGHVYLDVPEGIKNRIDEIIIPMTNLLRSDLFNVNSRFFPNLIDNVIYIKILIISY